MSDKLAYSVDEAAGLLSISRTLMWDEIASGRVKTVKIGRRTLVPRWALDERLSPATSVKDLIAQLERSGTVEARKTSRTGKTTNRRGNPPQIKPRHQP